MKKFISVLLSVVMLLSAFSACHSAVAAQSISCTCPKSITAGSFKAIEVKQNGKKIKASSCVFSSSNPSVAKVSADGTVYGYSRGSAVITVMLKSDNSISKKYSVKVKANTLSTPSLNMTFTKGKSSKLIVYSGKSRVGSAVKYSSSNSKIASVSSSGVITAKKKGNAVITVKKGSSKLSVKINVADGKSFSIDSTSGPLNAQFTNYSTINGYTYNYYTIRSYMEYAEKHSGLTLNMNSGVYNLTTAIYIPSNTTIKLGDGATINSTSKTGCSINNSGSMFMFVEPSKANKQGAHSKYDGVHNSKVIGRGKVVFDLKDSPSDKVGIGFVLGHNQNISISGITFVNSVYGHFIELDASKNVSITDCCFKDAIQRDGSSSSECINLDTPDKVTNGFHQVWTSYDKTPNDNITISNCVFDNVQRGVGTHQYSQGKYHTNIKINNCSFNNCFYGAVGVMNWHGAVIEGNTFNCIGKNSSGDIINNYQTYANRAVGIYGSENIRVRGNSFSNAINCIYISSHNDKNGVYDTTYSNITDDEYNEMSTSNTFDRYSCNSSVVRK